MKKKLIGLLVLMLSLIFMVACSSKSELNGKYYLINSSEVRLRMVISDNGGSVDWDGKDYAIVNVDDSNKQVTVSTDFGDKTYNLHYKDGKAIFPSNNNKDEVYKQGTKAFDEAMKKYGYTEKDLDD